MFVSPTHGAVDMPTIARLIRKRSLEADGEYNVLIGTDSQNFDTTKMVVVIALHHVGRGGIFFYEIQNVRRMNDIAQKLRYETMLSLDCAEALMREFEVLRKTDAYDMEKHLSFSIHVDAGANGPSKKMIPEVIGWINACGYTAVIKPDSYAASGIANKYSK